METLKNVLYKSLKLKFLSKLNKMKYMCIYILLILALYLFYYKYHINNTFILYYFNAPVL